MMAMHQTPTTAGFPAANADQPTLWRDLTDPRRASEVADVEAGLKAPEFENIVIPENFGPVRILIDEHKVKRYSFTHDDYLPWSADSGSFEAGTPVQAALLANDLLQLYTTGYAASQVVGLHTEEEMWFENPLHLGETVTLSGSYTDAYTRRGEGYVVLEGKATGPDGRTIVRHRGTEIFKTVPGAIGGRGNASPTRRVTGDVPANARWVKTLGPDTLPGDALAPISKTITFEQAAVFSRLGEYVTNTHTNLATARAAKLQVPIVQGQQQFGLMAQLLSRAFGGSFLRSGWLKAKFLVPVSVFDELELSGIVTEVVAAESNDGQKVAKLDVWVRRSDGRLVTVGWASAIID